MTIEKVPNGNKGTFASGDKWFDNERGDSEVSTVTNVSSFARLFSAVHFQTFAISGKWELIMREATEKSQTPKMCLL